jgi:hypothetical protein
MEMDERSKVIVFDHEGIYGEWFRKFPCGGYGHTL